MVLIDSFSSSSWRKTWQKSCSDITFWWVKKHTAQAGIGEFRPEAGADITVKASRGLGDGSVDKSLVLQS